MFREHTCDIAIVCIWAMSHEYDKMIRSVAWPCEWQPPQPNRLRRVRIMYSNIHATRVLKITMGHRHNVFAVSSPPSTMRRRLPAEKPLLSIPNLCKNCQNSFQQARPVHNNKYIVSIKNIDYYLKAKRDGSSCILCAGCLLNNTSFGLLLPAAYFSAIQFTSVSIFPVGRHMHSTAHTHSDLHKCGDTRR